MLHFWDWAIPVVLCLERFTQGVLGVNEIAHCINTDIIVNPIWKEKGSSKHFGYYIITYITKYLVTTMEDYVGNLLYRE